MEYDLNTTLIKPCLYSHDIIIESTKEQFEKKIKENKGKADRIAKLIIKNKELYLQSEEKAEWVLALNIANRKIAFQSESYAKQMTKLTVTNKELVDRTIKLVIANKELTDLVSKLVISNKELALQSKCSSVSVHEIIL